MGARATSSNLTMAQEGYISDTTIWKMRDEIEPPYEGLVMFSSSGAEYNIEQLIEMGVDESDCYEVEYAGSDTVWIPIEEYERIMDLTRKDDAYWAKLYDEQPERFDEDGIYHPEEE